MTFRQKLEAAWERSGSLLCIGLDPDPSRMAIDDVAAFIVCRTSDPGAPDLQDLPVRTEGGDRPLYEVVAERAKAWDRDGNVGLVVGATYPGDMRRLRALCPEAPILIPGIGAQEGSL